MAATVPWGKTRISATRDRSGSRRGARLASDPPTQQRRVRSTLTLFIGGCFANGKGRDKRTRGCPRRFPAIRIKPNRNSDRGESVDPEAMLLAVDRSESSRLPCAVAIAGSIGPRPRARLTGLGSCAYLYCAP